MVEIGWLELWHALHGESAIDRYDAGEQR